MGAIIPNVAKGIWRYYLGLPAANDALVIGILQGSETDDNLRDCNTLAAIIATAVDEATFTGYARLIRTSGVTISQDNTNNWVLGDDTTDPSWNPTSAQAITRVFYGYDPDTTGGTDTDIIPLFIDDFAFTTPATGTIAYTVFSTGLLKAA